MRWLVIFAIVASVRSARADSVDTVALAPLDADQRLELYGQPVATQLARALTTGGIDVIVLAGRNPKMPASVRLVVNGKIEGQGDAIVLTVTVRDLALGETIDTLTARAPALKQIETAAADLAAQLLSTLKSRIAALHQPSTDVNRTRVEPAKPRKMVMAVSTVIGGAEALRNALGDAVTGWSHEHRRELQSVEAKTLSAGLAPKTVAANESNLGMLFEVHGFSIDAGEVPMAHARVRVRIADASSIVFDRVIVTDTVVGERKMSAEALASRTAREVLAIVAPFVHRKVSGW